MRTFGIFLWHERHHAGIHTARSCTSGATYAIVTHVLLQLHPGAKIINGEKHYLGLLHNKMKREPKRLLVKFFKSFTTEVM